MLRNRSDKLLYIDYSYSKPVDASETGSSEERVAVFRYALITANAKLAQRLIDSGVDWQTPDEEGAEPIHDAAMGGDPSLVSLLLQMGADPNQRSSLGRTPLCEAAYARRPEAALALLQAGADPNVRPQKGPPPLIEAGARGSAETMRQLVENGADPNTYSDYGQHYSPLMYAAELGDVELVQELIDKGADIEALDLYGKRALMHAAVYGHINVVTLLLDRGADINATDQGGNTALWWANKEKPDLIRLFLERGAKTDVRGYNDRSVISGAVIRGQLDVIKMLLKADAPVESPDKIGRSALQAATDAGQLEVVKFLMEEKRPDVNYRDREFGETPLMCAAKSGSGEMVRLLISHGADVSVKDNRHQTALHFAAGKANCEAIAALMENNAVADIHNDLGHTPLIQAASTRSYWKKDSKCVEAVKILLDHHALVDAEDNDGWTALFHTAYDGHAETAQILIEAGADVSKKDKKNKVPLTIAVGRRQAHPYEDRRTWQPDCREADTMFDVILVLLKAEKKRGLHWKRLQSLIKTAEKWRCPEMVEFLKGEKS